MLAQTEGRKNSVSSTTVVKPTLRDIRRYTGRMTGPQQFDNFAFAANFQRVVPKPVPMAQPLAAFQFEFKGRIVIGVANYTSVYPESLLNLFQNIKWTGTHATLSNQTPWNGPGPTLFKLMKLCGVKGNDLYINNVRLTDDVLSNGIPTATFGNTGTYDVDLIMTVPVFPFGIDDSQAMLYFYNEQAWGSTINMTVQMADGLTCFGVPGTATTTFSGFGTGAGAAQVNINVVYGSLGPLAGRIGQAVCVRNDQPITSVLQTNSATLRLALLQNQRTTFVIAKTGTAGAGAGQFATLSDTILEQTIIRKNNTQLRNLFNNSTTKAFYGWRMQTVQPVGYLGEFFDDAYSALNTFAAYEGDNPAVLPQGAQFDIASQVVGATGNNIGEVVQEYIIGHPVVNLS